MFIKAIRNALTRCHPKESICYSNQEHIHNHCGCAVPKFPIRRSYDKSRGYKQKSHHSSHKQKFSRICLFELGRGSSNKVTHCLTYIYNKDGPVYSIRINQVLLFIHDTRVEHEGYRKDEESQGCFLPDFHKGSFSRELLVSWISILSQKIICYFVMLLQMLRDKITSKEYLKYPI